MQCIKDTIKNINIVIGNTTYSDFIKNVPTNRKYVVKECNKTLTEKDLIKTGQTLTT